MKLITALLCILFSALACNSLPPPSAITVRSEDSDTVRAAAYAARDTWCNADVGWCPEIVPFGGADIFIRNWDGQGGPAGPGDSLDEAGWEGPAGHEDGWQIEVTPWLANDTDLPWILAHEFGHFCIHGHPRGSVIMAPDQAIARPAMEIDEVARDAWLNSCP